MYTAASTLVRAQKVMLTRKAPDPENPGGQPWACGEKKPLAVPVMVYHG
jgi:hypothetical protein